MALVLNNFVGFETLGGEEVLSMAGNAVFNANPRTGSGSLSMSGASNTQVTVSPFEDGASDQGSSFDYITGFWVRFGDVTAAHTSFFLIQNSDSSGKHLSLSLLAGGTLQSLDNANTIIDETTPGFVNDTYHHIEIRWQDVTSGNLDVYIDGSATAITSTNANMDTASAIGHCKFNMNSTAIFFDDFYFMSGASGTADFLGDSEVFVYQGVGTPTENDDPLTTGDWPLVGETPSDDSAGHIIEYDGGALSGSVDTDGSSRDGPNGDANVDGTIAGAKWIHRLKRGNGSGTTHNTETGNSVDGTGSTAVTLSGAYANFLLVSEAAAKVPLSTEYFQHGISKSTGGREITCSEIWSMLLHVPSGVDTADQEIQYIEDTSRLMAADRGIVAVPY